jgi:hypothetical protein
VAGIRRRFRRTSCDSDIASTMPVCLPTVIMVTALQIVRLYRSTSANASAGVMTTPDENPGKQTMFLDPPPGSETLEVGPKVPSGMVRGAR